jgi:curli biogenesis system outer membrane secretion channel CsgG
MYKFKVIVVCFSFLFLLSCSSLFQRKNLNQQGLRVQQRSVPISARSSVYGVKKRVVVLPFYHNIHGVPLKVVEVAHKHFVKKLTESGRFIVLDYNLLSGGLQKYFNSKTKQYELESLLPSIENIGAVAVVEGELLNLDAKKVGDSIGIVRKIRAKVDAVVRLRVVASLNSKTMLNEKGVGSQEAETTRVIEYSYSDRFLREDPYLVQNSVDKAFQSKIPPLMMVMEKLSWEGRVAYVEGEKVFINAGRLSGIQIGDILKVTELGKEVYDPENGNFIGRTPGRMKGTLEVISYFGKDGAITQIHSGAGFTSNDRVDLY